MKRYALNFSFTNGSIICVVVESDLNESEFRESLKHEIKKDIVFVTDVNRATYMFQRDKLNYFMCSELQDDIEGGTSTDELRGSEVEEEAPSHPEA